MKPNLVQAPAYYGFMRMEHDSDGFDALVIADEGEILWTIPLKPEYTLHGIIDSASQFARHVYIEAYNKALSDVRDALGISHA